MKVLLTGASSFTGYWFARALHMAGHEVVAPLSRARRDYDTGARSRRVRLLDERARIVEHCPFGSDAFLDLAEREDAAVLCHHAAQAGDADNIDSGSAFAGTRRMPEVLARLSRLGLMGVVLTGTCAEPEEAAGTEPRGAVAGLCAGAGLSYGKFTLPNPFGPLAEDGDCADLVARWKAGQVAEVRRPSYVRDNIHVDLLALSFADFVAAVGRGRGLTLRRNPSGYIESQGTFTARFAAAMRRRSGLACGVRLAAQASFPEPMVRVNTEPAAPHYPDWDETAAWDKVATFYDLAAARLGPRT